MYFTLVYWPRLRHKTPYSRSTELLHIHIHICNGAWYPCICMRLDCIMAAGPRAVFSGFDEITNAASFKGGADSPARIKYIISNTQFVSQVSSSRYQRSRL